MPSCLLVRPALSADLNGGDSVVYRRLESYMAARAELDVIELEPLSRASQLLNVAKGMPPEAARYAGQANRSRLAGRLAKSRYDAVVFGHEAAFPLSTLPMPEGTRKIFFSHNVQSTIGETDRSFLRGALRPAAVAFDKRWYSDPTARVICISRADVAGLRQIGVDRPDIAVAPPGAPPAVELRPDARVLEEMVLTGSYGWWRKRRDLKRFAAEPLLPYPILVSDPLALEILGPQARPVGPREMDWSSGLRFALITDRFNGGFKLKSLEYVALNGLILSFCDLSAEFEDLPHGREFVRFVRSKPEVTSVVESVTAEPAEAVLSRFRTFKAACMARYQWEACLEPLGRLLA